MTTEKRTLADLSAIHDKNVMIPNRIKQALAALAVSGNDWTYEADFIKDAKPPISATDISRFRGQFADFWAECFFLATKPPRKPKFSPEESGSAACFHA